MVVRRLRRYFLRMSFTYRKLRKKALDSYDSARFSVCFGQISSPMRNGGQKLDKKWIGHTLRTGEKTPPEWP